MCQGEFRSDVACRCCLISVADDPVLLRVSDQGFEVLCEEVQRWESPDQPTIRLTSKDLLKP